MLDILNESIENLVSSIQSGSLKSVDLVDFYIDRINKFKEYNAVIEIFDDARDLALEMDKKVANGFKGKLAGIPIIIKDNILYENHKASCASKMLENFVSPFNATVVDKLLKEGAIILGRANMDEFAMGSSTETSFYGKTLNALDKSRVPGGSSGGSAVAVALNLCPVALGTDTGGSVRQPASFNGIIGLKPSYGRVSRYGIIAYGSSLDQVGVLAKNTDDTKLIFDIISGHSENDMTSIKNEVKDSIDSVIENLKIGVPIEIKEMMKGMPCENAFYSLIDQLKNLNCEIVDVSLPNIKLVLPTYYIIATAEATSNLARFDGVKYTYRSKDSKSLEEVYLNSRSEGFGEEVKRRIMLGNYVLSSGYYDAYYKKAKSLQNELKNEFKSALKNVDLILLPTTKGEAYKLGEKTNPIDSYREDIFTVSANITSLPAISVPYMKGEHNMPFGMQFIANYFEENKLFKISEIVEKLAKN